MKFAEYAKMYAALVGSVLTALAGTTGVVPAGAQPWVALALAVVTAVATWALPNKSDDLNPPPPAWTSQGPAWDVPAPTEAEDDKPQSLYLIAA